MSNVWEFAPLVSIGPFLFGMDRKEARSLVKQRFRSILKAPSSTNLMDAYDGFHLHFDGENKLIAVEVFGKSIVVTKDGTQLFPGKCDLVLAQSNDWKELLGSRISKALSTGFDLTEDETEIESILFGIIGYYSSI